MYATNWGHLAVLRIPSLRCLELCTLHFLNMFLKREVTGRTDKATHCLEVLGESNAREVGRVFFC